MPRGRTPPRWTWSHALLAPTVVLALLAPMAAHAVDVSLKVEPAAAVALSAPQSEVFGVGVGESGKVLFGLTPWLDIGPHLSFHYLPSSDAALESGVIWGYGGGLRLKRPHDAESLAGLSPWLDADLLLIRTGELARPGLDVGVGLAVPVDDARHFWIGPFVRYLQVTQPGTDVTVDDRDAKLLTVGLSLEFGSGVRREPEPVAVVAPQAPGEAVVSCADRDADGVPDVVDRCPEVAGTADGYGCPEYQKIIVRPDKLELKEKLYFALNEATIEPESHAALDEVVLAMQANKGFRVQVEGHADSSGPNDHNQTLSEDRAQAVLDYLVAHGVSTDRLVSKGFSSSVPTDTNQTAAGRENNRRVEFVVYFILLNHGSGE